MLVCLILVGTTDSCVVVQDGSGQVHAALCPEGGGGEILSAQIVSSVARMGAGSPDHEGWWLGWMVAGLVPWWAWWAWLVG